MTEGGSGTLQTLVPFPAPAPMLLDDTRDLLARQAMRYQSGSWSPDIERVMNGENAPGGGGPGGPAPGGGGPAPGGGQTPGGGSAPSIPGLEPVPGGGQASGGQPPTSIPGMEPVPGPSGPAIEPVPGGGPAAGGEAPTGPATERPMLRQGSIGDAVREMQELLVRHGATIDPDGNFGPLTKKAVIVFQGRAGLGVDGIVGPKTWGALSAP